MPFARVNGVRLAYEIHGRAGAPLVLVHGSWTSRRSWAAVIPRLAETFTVIAYDRRGHSESERTPGQGRVTEDATDLGALIESLGISPAWVAANSFGSSITLRLAGMRPDLFRGIIAHEPPLFALLARDQAALPLLDEASARVALVIERIAAGDDKGAAEQFVDTVALGPGSWAKLPPEVKEVFIENAPTFLDEGRDPEQLKFDTSSVENFPHPVLLTSGGKSPPTFSPVVAILAAAFPRSETRQFPEAGHVPHMSHPDEWYESLIAFTGQHDA